MYFIYLLKKSAIGIGSKTSNQLLHYTLHNEKKKNNDHDHEEEEIVNIEFRPKQLNKSGKKCVVMR